MILPKKNGPKRYCKAFNVNKRFVYILNFYIVKSDVLTKYLTMFWFPMIINEYIPIHKKFETCEMWEIFISKAPPPSCYEQNRCTECTLQHL